MRPLRRLLLVAALGGMLASLTMAAEDERIVYPGKAAPAASPVETGKGWGSFTLVAGLGLAAAGAWLIWRGRQGPMRTAEHRALTIAETRSLGNRQFLVVAAYENKKFLLGVCPGRIDLLAPLHDEKPGS